jgi:hypothetical protein
MSTILQKKFPAAATAPAAAERRDGAACDARSPRARRDEKRIWRFSRRKTRSRQSRRARDDRWACASTRREGRRNGSRTHSRGPAGNRPREGRKLETAQTSGALAPPRRRRRGTADDAFARRRDTEDASRASHRDAFVGMPRAPSRPRKRHRPHQRPVSSKPGKRDARRINPRLRSAPSTRRARAVRRAGPCRPGAPRSSSPRRRHPR